MRHTKSLLGLTAAAAAMAIGTTVALAYTTIEFVQWWEPEMPAGATFNAEEQARYRAFKEARRGAADYMAMEGEFKKYLDERRRL